MLNKGLLVAMISGVALVGNLDAAAITIFNSGQGISGGATDTHFACTSGTVTCGGAMATVITSPLGFPPWIQNQVSPDSKWINGATVAGDVNSAPGTYTLSTTFSLAGFIANSLTLTIGFAVDDFVTIVINNGSTNTTVATNASGSSSLQSLVLTNANITGGWGAGVNTISFQITNSTVGNPNPTGLQVQLSGDATPQAGGVPEPTTMALLGAGLLGVGLLRRRSA